MRYLILFLVLLLTSSSTLVLLTFFILEIIILQLFKFITKSNFFFSKKYDFFTSILLLISFLFQYLRIQYIDLPTHSFFFAKAGNENTFIESIKVFRDFDLSILLSFDNLGYMLFVSNSDSLYFIFSFLLEKLNFFVTGNYDIIVIVLFQIILSSIILTKFTFKLKNNYLFLLPLVFLYPFYYTHFVMRDLLGLFLMLVFYFVVNEKNNSFNYKITTLLILVFLSFFIRPLNSVYLLAYYISTFYKLNFKYFFTIYLTFCVSIFFFIQKLDIDFMSISFNVASLNQLIENDGGGFFYSLRNSLFLFFIPLVSNLFGPYLNTFLSFSMFDGLDNFIWFISSLWSFYFLFLYLNFEKTHYYSNKILGTRLRILILFMTINFFLADELRHKMFFSIIFYFELLSFYVLKYNSYSYLKFLKKKN